MCQLSLVDTGNNLRNSIYLTALLVENSRTANKDGVGVFNKTRGLYKSEKTASSLLNLGEIIIGEIDEHPVIGHVRAATTTLGKKVIDQAHTHPFEGTHYVLAHNGSLEFEDKALEEGYKDKDLIDSAIFHAELEKAYTGDVTHDLIETMKLFRGKFAMLVYHKDDDTFWVVRGRTAPLWVVQITTPDEPTKAIGIIVNTDKESLERASLLSSNMLQHIEGRFDYTQPVIVPSESIHCLNPIAHTLVKTGDILELDKVVAKASTTNFTPPEALGTTNGQTNSGKSGPSVGPQDSPISEIIDFVGVSGLDLVDIDRISQVLLGKGMIDFTKADLANLVEYLDKLRSRFNHKVVAMWSEMTMYAPPLKLYHMYPQLKYPYFLTEGDTFKNIYHDFRIKFMKKDDKNDILQPEKCDECGVATKSDSATNGSSIAIVEQPLLGL